MTGTLGPAENVRRARDLAQRLLVDLPERWRHTIGVARRAEQLTAAIGSSSDADTLLMAAWLHDIGYAGALHDTGFHPIDGARYLQGAGWPARIVGLVAHHSAALHVAHARALDDAIAPFTRESSPVSDALIYADQTVGPHGRTMAPEQRMADMLDRHGPHSAQATAHAERAPVLRAAIRRVERRLSLPSTPA